jgi:cytoskeletal protein RodZ
MSSDDNGTDARKRRLPRPPQPTLLGIGAPGRPAPGTNEVVALSPGLLSVKPSDAPRAEGTGSALADVFDAGDWDIDGSPPSPSEVPLSVDEFVETLSSSIPPGTEPPPSSEGAPALSALTHHEPPSPARRPRVDEFLVNLSAARAEDQLLQAPTIDVSSLTTSGTSPLQAPTIDVSGIERERPVERGATTRPLYELASEPASRASGLAARKADTPPPTLRPADLPESEAAPRSPRERRHVVAPATRSVPPPQRRSSNLVLPLMLLGALGVGAFVWRSAGTTPSAPHQPAAEAAPLAPAAVETALPQNAPEPSALPAQSAALASSTAPPAKTPGASAVSALKAEPSERARTEARTVAESALPSGAKADSVSVETAVETDASPEPAEPEAPPAGPFDKTAAAQALQATATQASACRKEGDPTGVASVVVTFAPSGRVTSATITGPPFAGTSTGGCIAAALRKTKIPAFDGDRVTVSKTVVIP